MSQDGGLFKQLLEDGQLIRIGMGESRCISFGAGIPGCVGTQGLAASTVVIIVSHHAVIFAHMTPTCDLHRYMDTIERAYRQFPTYFAAAFSVVVDAGYSHGYNTLLIEPTADIIEARLKIMGLRPGRREYNAESTSSALDRGGTVVVDGRGSTVEVYIEDVLIVSLKKSPADPRTSYQDGPFRGR
ncbi:MAG: hypothetical protein M1825_000134 [Sarcosagium campestre]|nr:MAG: hypothetical protein M1825_000134 [Sarcosagium campestre]